MEPERRLTAARAPIFIQVNSQPWVISFYQMCWDRYIMKYLLERVTYTMLSYIYITYCSFGGAVTQSKNRKSWKPAGIRTFFFVIDTVVVTECE